MLKIPKDCIILEGAVCSGERSTGRWFCPREIYPTGARRGSNASRSRGATTRSRPTRQALSAGARCARCRTSATRSGRSRDDLA